MWVSRNKIISSTQKKVISKQEDYSLIDDADLIAPRCPFLRKKTGDRGRHRGPRGPPMTSSFFVETDTLVRLKPSHSLDFVKYVAKGVIGDLSVVALYTSGEN